MIDRDMLLLSSTCNNLSASRLWGSYIYFEGGHMDASQLAGS